MSLDLAQTYVQQRIWIYIQKVKFFQYWKRKNYSMCFYNTYYSELVIVCNMEGMANQTIVRL